MKKQVINPYLPNWEYVPDGIQSLYFTFSGQGHLQFAGFELFCE